MVPGRSTRSLGVTVDRPRKPEPFWLAGFFLVVGLYLFMWVGMAGVREWFALVLLVTWAILFAVGVRSELAGQTRLAWALGAVLFVVPWAVSGLQLACIVATGVCQ
jgi:hypothetical protein